MSVGIVWETPPSVLADAIEAYAEKIVRAVALVGEMLAPEIEAWAKANASWTDRTGEARAKLAAISQAAEDMVTVYLYHGSDHGKWLEIAHGAPYRIIMPALTAHFGRAMQLVAEVVGGV